MPMAISIASRAYAGRHTDISCCFAFGRGRIYDFASAFAYAMMMRLAFATYQTYTGFR